MMYCTKCQERIRQNANYCIMCGTRVMSGGGKAGGILLADGDEKPTEAVQIGKIICNVGDSAGKSYPIYSTQEIYMGTDAAQCQIIQQSKYVSRRHCGIRYAPEQNGYLVTDYSSNGTYINGSKISRGIAAYCQKGTIIVLAGENNQYTLV